MNIVPSTTVGALPGHVRTAARASAGLAARTTSRSLRPLRRVARWTDGGLLDQARLNAEQAVAEDHDRLLAWAEAREAYPAA